MVVVAVVALVHIATVAAASAANVVTLGSKRHRLTTHAPLAQDTAENAGAAGSAATTAAAGGAARSPGMVSGGGTPRGQGKITAHMSASKGKAKGKDA